MSRSCCPVYTAGRCLTGPERAALAALTLALTAFWLPFAAITRHRTGRGQP